MAEVSGRCPRVSGRGGFNIPVDLPKGVMMLAEDDKTWGCGCLFLVFVMCVVAIFICGTIWVCRQLLGM